MRNSELEKIFLIVKYMYVHLSIERQILLFSSGVANPRVPISFKSSSMRRTNERFQNINSESISDFPIFRPKIIMSSKKKKGLHSESISHFPIFYPKISWSSDMARYNLWNVFHLKYFPRLLCATTVGHP